MSLEELDLKLDAPDISPGTEALIREAESRIDAFLDRAGGPLVSPFLPSDFRLVYTALSEIAAERLASGPAFLEWGSGYGVVTCLASLLQFDACGVEIDEYLVDGARQLASDFDISTEFHCTSYLPAGFDYFEDVIGESRQLLRASAQGMPVGWYSALSAGVVDFDVIFAYPWPKEELLLEELFEQTASDGALYVTYHGLDDVRVRRKVGPQDPDEAAYDEDDLDEEEGWS